MTQLTVKALSEEIGTPVDRLLEQLADAGMKKSGSDSVTEDEKQKLLSHLRKEHGEASTAEPTRLTLQRKTRSTLSVNAGGGKSKNVQVEVRKKRTYVKRSTIEDEATREAEEAANREAEEQAKREAEEALKREAADAAKREAEEKAKRDAEEKAKRDADDKVKREAQEAKRERSAEDKSKQEAARKEADELKRRQEEEAKRKAEEESRRQLEKARELAELNKERWSAEEEKKGDMQEDTDYHVTTSRYAREAEDEADRREEGSSRRSTKANKRKMSSRDDKQERDSSRTRGGKAGRKGRISKPTSMQHGFDKSAVVAKSDVVIGETIVVSELAQ
ncbi:translation initiation factor IF-2 associated domain-containing protein, partial [Vibrio parahaemolyticus]|nr:translation initiation factor IF-2 associated domain-containing protein [Vibrio parahaemolyticus]